MWIIFFDDSRLDIGTIEDLVKAVRNNTHFKRLCSIKV